MSIFKKSSQSPDEEEFLSIKMSSFEERSQHPDEKEIEERIERYFKKISSRFEFNDGFVRSLYKNRKWERCQRCVESTNGEKEIIPWSLDLSEKLEWAEVYHQQAELKLFWIGPYSYSAFKGHKLLIVRSKSYYISLEVYEESLISVFCFRKTEKGSEPAFEAKKHKYKMVESFPIKEHREIGDIFTKVGESEDVFTGVLFNCRYFVLQLCNFLIYN